MRSNDGRSLVQILDLARLNALDAKARLVGNSDVFFVEHCTAEMGSSLHSTGPSRSTRVMICFAQARCTAAFTLILASSMQPIMHSTPYTSAADANLEGVVQAAALHQLDVHEVCGSHLHDGQCVLRGEHALVGQHRHIGALGNILQAFKIVGLDGCSTNSISRPFSCIPFRMRTASLGVQPDLRRCGCRSPWAQHRGWRSGVQYPFPAPCPP